MDALTVVLKRDVVFTNVNGADVIIPRETSILINYLDSGEILGKYGEDSFEVLEEEFATLH